MLAFSRLLRSVTFQYRYIQATGPTGLRSGFITSNGVDILMVMTNATCIAYPKESAQWRTVFVLFSFAVWTFFGGRREPGSVSTFVR